MATRLGRVIVWARILAPNLTPNLASNGVFSTSPDIADNANVKISYTFYSGFTDKLIDLRLFIVLQIR